MFKLSYHSTLIKKTQQGGLVSFITLGIDLGGCMSGNTAYALIEWSQNRPSVIDLFKEPKHKDVQPCFDFITSTLLKYNVDAICIDAPFSLPRSLIEPDFKAPPRDAKGEIANPFLYRYCDYWLYKNYGLRPMPPAGDRIGRLTARMIELLYHFDYQAPFLTFPERKTPIYEVYPKQIALALGYERYKDHTDEILQKFAIKDVEDEHLIDAILCSFCGANILSGKTIHPPKEAEEEGWCYPLVL